MSGFSQVILGIHFYGIYTERSFKLASFKNKCQKIGSNWAKFLIFFLNFDLKSLHLKT